MEIMVWLALIVFFVALEIATVGLTSTDHRICSGIIWTALFYKTMGTEIFETASGQDKL